MLRDGDALRGAVIPGTFDCPMPRARSYPMWRRLNHSAAEWRRQGPLVLSPAYFGSNSGWV